MKTLYIIGNGFDLHHNLQTTYGDFHNFLKDNNQGLIDFIEFYFNFQVNSNYLWSNFEEDLGSFDHSAFFSDYDNADIDSEDFRRSDYFGVEDELNEISGSKISDLREAFYDWINQVEVDCKPKVKFEKGAFFLSFNYTMVLQNVYHIPNCQLLHIHGSLKSKSELVFGHNVNITNEAEQDENGDSNRVPMTDSLNASKIFLHNFRKPVGDIIIDHSHFFSSLTPVEKIYVLGHSLSEIDLDYFAEVNKYSRNAIWFCSFFFLEEKQSFIQKLKGLGIRRSKIRMIKLDTF